MMAIAPIIKSVFIARLASWLPVLGANFSLFFDSTPRVESRAYSTPRARPRHACALPRTGDNRRGVASVSSGNDTMGAAVGFIDITEARGDVTRSAGAPAARRRRP